MSSSKDETMKRRTFLHAAATTAAAFTVLPAKSVRGLEANSKLQIGIIGCGMRGPWIGEFFEEHANSKVVALHDYFQDRVDEAAMRLRVSTQRRYMGLDGYKELLSDTSIDAVAVQSPPYYHPEQAVATLAAGKHLYLAKPIAVDVPGCLAIKDAAARAGGKLSAWVDFQTRANEAFQGAAWRVHEGNIGEPVCGQFHYYCMPMPMVCKDDGTAAGRLRNWVFDIALSGDIIVEQNIHVLDVANWYLQSHPLKARGAGGRKARTYSGDCRDHFLMTYTYPDDVLVEFSSGQFTYGFDDMCMRLFCTRGTVDSHYGGEVTLRGKSFSWDGGRTNTIYVDGAINNVIKFAESIRNNEPINNVDESANSNLTSILGRMAADTGEEITWDGMLARNERVELDLDLPADGPFHVRQRPVFP
ncbi:MAG: Gfo/Idh/MocA family oxidoreductase [Candidatus Hydrogenedens sp.]|jgi:predicted dehydrogenase|nr:Gfo/Idh/MocA family oxidoreductase [Candidatus Hydrogenedens sp.]